MLLERVSRKIKRHGEQFTVNGTTYDGVFKILDSSTMRNYLDDVEVMGVTKPGLLLITDGDADIDVSDQITRDGRTYTVLKTSKHRIGGVVVVRLAILS